MDNEVRLENTRVYGKRRVGERADERESGEKSMEF